MAADPLPSGRPPVLPSSRLTFHLIPHTHWDREWYLTRAAFQARLVPVLDDALAHLERDPAARFVLDGQTVLLEDYLAIRPEQEARIAALVRRGALEIGPWYVLSDLLIPGAASLRRNLEEGARDAARFGRRLDVLYSPDAFGHPAGLPDLAGEFGLRWAVVRRGLGRPSGVDRDLYRWDGEAGGSLLVLHLPPTGYEMASALADAGSELGSTWTAIRDPLIHRAVTDQIAVFLGADHHAMVRDLSGLRQRLQALEPDHLVRISGLTEYFESVERAQPQPRIIEGELRRGDGHTWVLQGVHSARARLKRAHAERELFLGRCAAPLARLVARPGGSNHEPLLRAAWRTLLESQFHDTLAGTTCDAVQDEQALRLEAVAALAGEIARRSLWELAGHDPDRSRLQPDRVTPQLILWNPVRRARTGILTAELTFFRRDVVVGPPGDRFGRTGTGIFPIALETSGGGRIPVQVLGVRRGQEMLSAPRHYPHQDEVDRACIAFRGPELAGLSVTRLPVRPAQFDPADEGLEVKPGLLSNRYVSVRVSPTGVLALTDQRTGEQYRGLGELRDETDRGDLYTFSRGGGPELRRGHPELQAVLAAGPLVGALETRWTLSSPRGRIGARLLVVLHADSPLVRLRLDLAHQAAGHRLRARFPTGVGGGKSARVGAAFGVVEREAASLTRSTVTLEQEVATAPAQRFVAVAGGSRGLGVLAPGFFESEWTRSGDLLVTLVRAVGELSRSDLPERPGHAAWPMPAPAAQEPGLHRIELALVALRGEAELKPARLERLWEDAFLPVQACWVRDYSEVSPSAARG